MSLENLLSIGKFEETDFKNPSFYPDTGISIIIYRLSDIYLSQTKIKLFGIMPIVIKIRLTFVRISNLDKA